MSKDTTEYVASLEKELHEEREQRRHLQAVLGPAFKEIRLIREKLEAASFSRQPMLRKASWKNAIDSKVAVVAGVPRVGLLVEVV